MHSESMDHAMRLPSLQFLNHSRALPAKNSLHTLDHDRLLGWNAFKQLQFTAAAFFVFVSLLHEAVYSLFVEQAAVQRPEVIKLDDEGNDIRSTATSADNKQLLEDHQPLLCTAEAPRPGSVHSCFVQKRDSLSFIMSTAHQSKRMGRTGFDEEAMKVAREGVKNVKNVAKETPKTSNALPRRPSVLFML